MELYIDRRKLLVLGGAAALGSLVTPAAASAAPAGFPGYTYIGTPFVQANLRYNPTGELNLPCIRGV